MKTATIFRKISFAVLLLMLVLGTQPIFAEGDGESQNSSSKSKIHHTVEMSPLSPLSGIYAMSYSLTAGKNGFGLIGGPIWSPVSTAKATGYIGGAFYVRNFEYFEQDPNFIGAALVYYNMEGTYKVGSEETFKAGLEATVASLSIFYGNAYVWKNGFSMSWRLGVAIPLQWDYKWENLENTPDKQFKDDTETFETISKVFSTILGGSGWNIGWSF